MEHDGIVDEADLDVADGPIAFGFGGALLGGDAAGAVQ